MSLFFTGKTIRVRFLQTVFLLVFTACFSLPLSSFSQNDSTLHEQPDTAIKPDTVAAEMAATSQQDTMAHAEESAATAENHESSVSQGHSVDEVKRGKRFFLGILPFKREHQACVSCHNLKPVDTLHWYPSAYDIAVKYAGKDFASFQQAVMSPSGDLMTASHQNFDIPEEDLKTVKTYLDDLAVIGPPPPKPSINNIILFLFLGLLITWAILELIIFKTIKYKIIPVVILLGAFGWQVNMLVGDAIRLGRQQNYAPDQPVKFSHKVHAGENNIDCKYCHTTVEYSKSAGIPATNLCMNCHIIIREGTNSGKFEISKVVNAVEQGESIEWIRIHNLPDHVFFNHSVHVGSAKIDCNTCHGPVEEMNIMRQYNDLSMGWCVNCHRETETNFVNNDYYDDYIKLHEALKSGEKDVITAEDVGANDCMRCHY